LGDKTPAEAAVLQLPYKNWADIVNSSKPQLRIVQTPVVLHHPPMPRMPSPRIPHKPRYKPHSHGGLFDSIRWAQSKAKERDGNLTMKGYQLLSGVIYMERLTWHGLLLKNDVKKLKTMRSKDSEDTSSCFFVFLIPKVLKKWRSDITSHHALLMSGCFFKKTDAKSSTSSPNTSPVIGSTLTHNSPFQSTNVTGRDLIGRMTSISVSL